MLVTTHEHPPLSGIVPITRNPRDCATGSRCVAGGLAPSPHAGQACKGTDTRPTRRDGGLVLVGFDTIDGRPGAWGEGHVDFAIAFEDQGVIDRDILGLDIDGA